MSRVIADGLSVKAQADLNLSDKLFTNALKNKLDAIEANATADQTKADIDALNIDADTLDDYEEGTFTLVLTPSTSGSFTLAIDTMSYVKIGRVVHVQGLYQANLNSPVGTEIGFSGLPFASRSDSFSGRSGGAFWQTNKDVLGWRMRQNSTSGKFFMDASTVGTASAGQFYVGMTYQTN